MIIKGRKNPSSRVLIQIDPNRHHRACTQSFHIITPIGENYHNIFILGSGANEYIITTTRNSISCNCPDSNPACKHILFLLHASGVIEPRTDKNHVFINPMKLLSLINSSSRKPPLLSAALLDSHTNSLCFRHQYPPCFFCNENQAHREATLIICSKCGYLGHQHCFLAAFTAGSNCPKCCRPFFALKARVQNGYRNYLSILKHFDYVTDDSHASYTSGSPGGVQCRLVNPHVDAPLDLPVPLPIPSAHLVPSSPAVSNDIQSI
jgi:hypothetical protein